MSDQQTIDTLNQLLGLEQDIIHTYQDAAKRLAADKRDSSPLRQLAEDHRKRAAWLHRRVIERGGQPISEANAHLRPPYAELVAAEAHPDHHQLMDALQGSEERATASYDECLPRLPEEERERISHELISHQEATEAVADDVNKSDELDQPPGGNLP